MDCFRIFSVVLVFFSSLSFTECKLHVKTFNVVDFGAGGNLQKDDTQAFLKAWEAACIGHQLKYVTPLVHVPNGREFLVKELRFNGPCNSSSIHFKISGKIFAPISPSELGGAKIWITFENVNGLTVFGDGVGVIDGRGSEWWKMSPSDASRPTALEFAKCDNLIVKGLKHINSQRNHIGLTNCTNVEISNLTIVAPETSPNTDGIDLYDCKYVNIHNSSIGTGDDCIAIGDMNYFINITSVYCGPGHGISIGSLGANGATNIVENIHVKNCTFNKTQNGARIKSWQGGSGYARKISFEDVTLIDTNDPIIIDQYYCPHRTDCANETKAVAFSDMSFVGFRGTSNSEAAITLNCSQSVACTKIYVDDINITLGKGNQIGEPKSTCINAYGRVGNNVKPKVDCLLK